MKSQQEKLENEYLCMPRHTLKSTFVIIDLGIRIIIRPLDLKMITPTGDVSGIHYLNYCYTSMIIRVDGTTLFAGRTTGTASELEMQHKGCD